MRCQVEATKFTEVGFVGKDVDQVLGAVGAVGTFGLVGSDIVEI